MLKIIKSASGGYLRFVPIFLGITFFISGWLKGVDPYGTSLQLEEYLRVFGWSCHVGRCCMIWSICLCVGELCMGLLLLSGVLRKLVAWGAMTVMVVFTALTGWLAFLPIGADLQVCGCFGEVLTLNHKETFLKNVVLLTLALWNLKIVWTECWCVQRWRTITCCVVLALIIPLYSAIWLPPMDFLPYNRGVNLCGHSEFAVFNNRYEDVTDSLMDLSEGKPLVVAVMREGIDASDRKKIKKIESLVGQGEISFCMLVTPDVEETGKFVFLYIDEVTQKSLLRAAKGILVIENGIIRAKWNLKVYPSFFINNATMLKWFTVWNSWTAFRYVLCLLAGLVFIGWVGRKEDKLIKRNESKKPHL